VASSACDGRAAWRRTTLKMILQFYTLTYTTQAVYFVDEPADASVKLTLLRAATANLD
jgi:hypothetical protein